METDTEPQKTVLIADDNASARELLRIILQRQGYLVLEAEDGTVACRLAIHGQPSLIFLDLNMPQMDGISAAKTLRAARHLRTVPIVALSAGLNESDSSRLKAAGFSRFLSKPVSPARLRCEVLELLSADSMKAAS